MKAISVLKAVAVAKGALYDTRHDSASNPSVQEVQNAYAAVMRIAQSLMPVRTRLVRLNSQGYDSSGTYYGVGRPLYCVSDDLGLYFMIRADSRQQALEECDDTIDRPQTV